MDSTKIETSSSRGASNLNGTSPHQKKAEQGNVLGQLLLKINKISLSGTSNANSNFQSKFYVYETISGARLYIKEDKWNSMHVCPADVYISKYMEQIHHSDNALQGKKTLAIGAGCGLVCMVTALLGAISTGSENSKAFELLSHNVKAFNAEYHRAYHPIAVRGSPIEDKERCTYDLVICSDSLYNKDKRAETLECLILSMNDNSVGYLIHTWRKEDAEREFMNNWLARIFNIDQVCSEKEIQEFCYVAHASKLLRTQSTEDIQNSTDKDGKVEVFKLIPVQNSNWESHANQLLIDFKNSCNQDISEISYQSNGNIVENADIAIDDQIINSIKKTPILKQLKLSQNGSSKVPQSIGLNRSKPSREISTRNELPQTKNTLPSAATKTTTKVDSIINPGKLETKSISRSMTKVDKTKLKKPLGARMEDLNRLSNIVKKVPKQ